MYSNIGGKRYEIYKSIFISNGWIQFSFVSSPDQPYYYINRWNSPGQWMFGWNVHWRDSWPAKMACSSNWLEILVVSGWTKEKVEQEITGRLIGTR